MNKTKSKSKIKSKNKSKSKSSSKVKISDGNTHVKTGIYTKRFDEQSSGDDNSSKADIDLGTSLELTPKVCLCIYVVYIFVI